MGLREVAYRVRIWVLKLLSQTVPPTDDPQTERGETTRGGPQEPQEPETENDEITSAASPDPPTGPRGDDSEPAGPDEPDSTRGSGHGPEQPGKPASEPDRDTSEAPVDPLGGAGDSDSEPAGPGKPSSVGGSGEGKEEQTVPQDETVGSSSKSSGTPDPDGTRGTVEDHESPMGTAETQTHVEPREGSNDESSRGTGHESEQTRTRPPREISSRRTTREPKASKPRYTPRPELICRSRGAQWELVLSAPDGCQIEKVQHGTVSLAYGGAGIQSFAGHLSVVYSGGQPLKLLLFEDKPLVFKLGTDWSGIGRQVRRVTHGHFIVIAPNDWKRTGHVPVEPDGCTDGAFLAHYFARSKGGSDDVGGFAEQELPLDGIAAELEGDVIFDDSREGPLFGGETAPSLKNSPGVVWVRVGEEREEGWLGKNFGPERTLADVLEERQGRFFVRIYDNRTKLLDSSEFRYLRGLSQIQVNDEPYTGRRLIAPVSTGHLPARVRFVGTTMLSPDVTSDHSSVKEGHILVDPHPDADELRCTLRAGGGAVDVRLNLPRIWWRLEPIGCHGGPSSDWSARAHELNRREFVDCAERGAIIRMRLPRWIEHCRVGFDDEADTQYRTDSGTSRSDPWSYLEVLLSDFIYHSQITGRLKEEVAFNIECDDTKLTPIRISRDPSPKIVSFACEPSAVEVGGSSTLIWETEDAEEAQVTIQPDVGDVASSGTETVKPTRSTTYTLKITATGLDEVAETVDLAVRSAVLPPPAGEMVVAGVQGGHGGLRSGKGFSDGEISAAGLTTRHLSHRWLRIDKRRRTIHPANVTRIRRVTDA